MSKQRRSSEKRLVTSNGGRSPLVVLVFMMVIASSLGYGEDRGFETLNGRWLRPDGGYVLDIQSVDHDGKITALYFNPHPINIAKAEAKRENSQLNVFVELRAPNYPGSTYTLVYDRDQDQLKGTYFQAALRQSFDVYFVRMK